MMRMSQMTRLDTVTVRGINIVTGRTRAEMKADIEVNTGKRTGLVANTETKENIKIGKMGTGILIEIDTG